MQRNSALVQLDHLCKVTGICRAVIREVLRQRTVRFPPDAPAAPCVLRCRPVPPQQAAPGVVAQPAVLSCRPAAIPRRPMRWCSGRLDRTVAAVLVHSRHVPRDAVTVPTGRVTRHSQYPYHATAVPRCAPSCGNRYLCTGRSRILDRPAGDGPPPQPTAARPSWRRGPPPQPGGGGRPLPLPPGADTLVRHQLLLAACAQLLSIHGRSLAASPARRAYV